VLIGHRLCSAPMSRIGLGGAQSPDAMHCPSLNVFGTFFPSWMLCAILGICAAAVAHKLFGLVRIRAELKPPLLVYSSVALTVTFLIWLVRYGS
jgi:hypothetical protein